MRFLIAFQKLPQRFSQSCRELKNTRSLTGISMLLAVSVVLSFFTVNLTESMKIGVGFVVTAALGMLYGPVAGALAAGTGDLITYLIRPTGPYFFGFTLTAMLGGLIYGMFFYKSSCTLGKAICSKTLITLLLNCLLNTFWISCLYGTPFSALLAARTIKNLITLPLEVILLTLSLTMLTKLVSRARIRMD